MLIHVARANGTSLRLNFGGAEEELVTDIAIATGTVLDAARDARDAAAFGTLRIKVGGPKDHDVDHDVARVAASGARYVLEVAGARGVASASACAGELCGADATGQLLLPRDGVGAGGHRSRRCWSVSTHAS